MVYMTIYMLILASGWYVEGTIGFAHHAVKSEVYVSLSRMTDYNLIETSIQ